MMKPSQRFFWIGLTLLACAFVYMTWMGSHSLIRPNPQVSCSVDPGPYNLLRMMRVISI